MTTLPSNAGYAEHADNCLKRYEARRSEDMHADWLHLFPSAPSKILDVGAGTGRDAGWLAGLGHDVTAVEPTAELREPAKKLHPHPNITWIDDILPELKTVRGRNEKYDFILMNAVWMHLTEDERARGMEIVAGLMAPGARWLMTLRHGPVPAGRRMFNVTGEETAALGARCGLTCLLKLATESINPENIARGITWTKVALAKE